MTKDENIPRLRLLPINQVAALKLRGAGIGENSEAQQVFQLMEWGIESDRRRRYADIAQELEILQSIDQQVAMDYLLRNLPGGMRGVLRTLLKADARTAARMLLDLLDMRLTADPYFSRDFGDFGGPLR